MGKLKWEVVKVKLWAMDRNAVEIGEGKAVGSEESEAVRSEEGNEMENERKSGHCFYAVSSYLTGNAFCSPLHCGEETASPVTNRRPIGRPSRLYPTFYAP